MKFSFTRMLAIMAIAGGLAAGGIIGAAAQSPAPPPGSRICSSEHRNVAAACGGNPCSPACKQAHQAMKQCRIANNLPKPQHKSSAPYHPKIKCPKPPPALPGSTAAPAP